MTVPKHSVFSYSTQVNSWRQPGQLKRSISNGKESKKASPAAWFCMAVEANRLLVLHSLWN